MPRPRPSVIPPELTNLRQWVAWKYVVRDDKKTKVPVGRHGHAVSVQDEQEWMSYSEASAVTAKAGVGFVFSATGPYCGVDLDACRNADTGDFTTEALDILEKLASYAEVSPSGTGVKIILKARMAEGSRHKVPAPWRATTAEKNAFIECYDKGRFFTITGSVLPGYSDVTSVGAAFVNELMRDAKSEGAKEAGLTRTESWISDNDLVDVARLFPSTAQMMANLFVEAKRDAYKSDESRCDFVLCCALARHTDRADQIERVFRLSALFKSKGEDSAAKWERADYVHRTISQAVKEKADERAKDLGLNYRTVRRLKAGDLEETASPLTVLETTNQLQRHTKGAFFGVGEESFLAAEEKGEEPVRVATHEELTALIGHRNDICIRWRPGTGFTTRPEAFAALRFTSPRFHSIETVPTHPSWPATYYNCPDLPPPSEGAWEAWLDFFNWATPQDRLLGAALFMTPFWGGPGGQRPVFAISSHDGQSSGKTTLVKMAGLLLKQTPIMFQAQDGLDVVDLTKRMLSAQGRRSRLVLLDNVTGRMANPDLAALVTSGEISGRQLNVGEGVRPNNVTYTLTLNAPSLDADFASRTVELRINRPPEGYSDWEERVTRFLGEHRWGIIAHIVETLRRSSSLTTSVPFRFPLWLRQVLGTVADEAQVGSVLELIATRRKEHNSDTEEAAVFAHEVLKLARLTLQSVDKRFSLTTQSCWIYNPLLTHLFRQVINKKNMGHPAAMKHLQHMDKRGDFKEWPIQFDVRRRVDGQQLTGAVVGFGEPITAVSDLAALG